MRAVFIIFIGSIIVAASIAGRNQSGVAVNRTTASRSKNISRKTGDPSLLINQSWTDKKQWAHVEYDLTEYDILEILGEPKMKKETRKAGIWFYGLKSADVSLDKDYDCGYVRFKKIHVDGFFRVSAWLEPNWEVVDKALADEAFEMKRKVEKQNDSQVIEMDLKEMEFSDQDDPEIQMSDPLESTSDSDDQIPVASVEEKTVQQSAAVKPSQSDNDDRESSNSTLQSPDSRRKADKQTVQTRTPKKETVGKNKDSWLPNLDQISGSIGKYFPFIAAGLLFAGAAFVASVVRKAK